MFTTQGPHRPSASPLASHSAGTVDVPQPAPDIVPTPGQPSPPAPDIVPTPSPEIIEPPLPDGAPPPAPVREPGAPGEPLRA